MQYDKMISAEKRSMSKILKDEHRNLLISMLIKAGFLDTCCKPGKLENMFVQHMTADGSNRQFYRIALREKSPCVLVTPEENGAAELREANAAWKIGKHLASCGVPVPVIYDYDEASGFLLCEDLGNTKLHDYAVTIDHTNHEAVAKLRALYRQIIEQLVTMQVRGRIGFSVNWCCDTPHYSKQLMLERESGYFLKAFWQDWLGKKVPAGINTEFSILADAAATAPGNYFLYRDFQSRNIMICDDQVRFIDYQGGRFGPLGYDLASLLIDPYVQLPEKMQGELYEYYVERLADLVAVDKEEFDCQYVSLSLQRNLQIIGAFAFLSKVRGKIFFADFILPALQSVQRILINQPFFTFSVLQDCVDQALDNLVKK